jgi:Trk K+ transport system NAD-binding subunit
MVLGIQRRDGRLEFAPESETSIQTGDKLLILGSVESLKRLEAEMS